MSLLAKTIPFTPFTIQQVIWAIVVAVVGYIIISWISSLFRKSLSKAGLPDLVADVFTKLLKVFLYVALILAVVRALGIQTGSVVLGLSAVIGLILGFGLQDTLNNLAAGVWIAVTRPFDKGDFIQVAGHSGTVTEVGVLSTVLTRPDNEVVMIPNRQVWGAPIVNYTRNPIRRINLSVGVAYGTDLDRAVRVALETVKSIEGVLKDPAPQVVVAELADSSINLAVRAWAKKEDYWTVRERIMKAIYNAFNREGIEIPFPQLDVHIRDMPGSGS